MVTSTHVGIHFRLVLSAAEVGPLSSLYVFFLIIIASIHKDTHTFTKSHTHTPILSHYQPYHQSLSLSHFYAHKHIDKHTHTYCPGLSPSALCQPRVSAVFTISRLHQAIQSVNDFHHKAHPTRTLGNELPNSKWPCPYVVVCVVQRVCVCVCVCPISPHSGTC